MRVGDIIRLYRIASGAPADPASPRLRPPRVLSHGGRRGSAALRPPALSARRRSAACLGAVEKGNHVAL
jgi:hypothetical protein